MKLKIFISFSAMIMVGVATTALFFITSRPTKDDFQHLVNPRFVSKKNIKALVVDFDGNANVVLEGAFTKLYEVYYSMDDVPKGAEAPAPFGRYMGLENISSPEEFEKLKARNWKGFAAIKIPDSISELPDEAGQGDYRARIDNVSYGEVAEVVHFGAYGPYKKELPSINKLKEFIKSSGYVISGLHEEEYIISPGSFFADPEDYITIIRYQVKKK